MRHRFLGSEDTEWAHVERASRTILLLVKRRFLPKDLVNTLWIITRSIPRGRILAWQTRTKIITMQGLWPWCHIWEPPGVLQSLLERAFDLCSMRSYIWQHWRLVKAWCQGSWQVCNLRSSCKNLLGFEDCKYGPIGKDFTDWLFRSIVRRGMESNFHCDQKRLLRAWRICRKQNQIGQFWLRTLTRGEGPWKGRKRR